MQRKGKNVHVLAWAMITFHNDDACNIPAFAKSCRTNTRNFCENMIIKIKENVNYPTGTHK